MKTRGAGTSGSKSARGISAENGSPSPRGAPKLLHYLYLTLAFWGFLTFQAVVLRRSLGSGQMVYLFSGILGLGFLGACLFDYTWLRTRR